MSAKIVKVGDVLYVEATYRRHFQPIEDVVRWKVERISRDPYRPAWPGDGDEIRDAGSACGNANYYGTGYAVHFASNLQARRNRKPHCGNRGGLMGADLYRHDIYDANKAKWEPAYQAALKARDQLIEQHGDARSQTDFMQFAHPAVAAAQEAVLELSNKCRSVGYFRDSYNSSSCLGRIALSWWRDVIPMLDEEGDLQPAKARELIRMVEEARAKAPRPRTAEELRVDHCNVDDDKNSPEEWERSYQEHIDKLLAFLKQAVEDDKPIYCSL